MADVVELQSLHVAKPAKESDVQEINPTLKKVAFAILALQGVLFFMLLAICVVAAKTQASAADLQDRLATRLPIIEGILDNYADAARFIHSSMPDVATRLLTSDKLATVRAVNVLATKVYSAFNSNAALSGASSVAQSPR